MLLGFLFRNIVKKGDVWHEIDGNVDVSAWKDGNNMKLPPAVYRREKEKIFDFKTSGTGAVEIYEFCISFPYF